MLKTLYFQQPMTKDQVLKCLEEVVECTDFEKLKEELAVRSRQGSVEIYPGLILPHIVSENVKQTTIVNIFLKRELKEWSPEIKNVKFMMVVLVKANEDEQVLKKVSRYVRLLADEHLCEQLTSCAVKVEVDKLIKKLEVE